MASRVNKPIKEERPIPYWKRRIPKCPERTEWKRDEDGFPIFFDDGVCTLCKGGAKKFSHPWYQFKYQILGYCEPCVTARMGAAPTPEQERAFAEKDAKKPVFRFISPTLSPDAAVKELEQLALAL